MNVRHLDDERHERARTTLTRAAAVIARRPTLWWPAACAAVRFAPRGWWHRPPFLPVPDERYWSFRMGTAFGDEGASPSDDDIAVALRWARRTRVGRR